MASECACVCVRIFVRVAFIRACICQNAYLGVWINFYQKSNFSVGPKKFTQTKMVCLSVRMVGLVACLTGCLLVCLPLFGFLKTKSKAFSNPQIPHLIDLRSSALSFIYKGLANVAGGDGALTNTHSLIFQQNTHTHTHIAEPQSPRQRKLSINWFKAVFFRFSKKLKMQLKLILLTKWKYNFSSYSLSLSLSTFLSFCCSLGGNPH